MDVSFSPDALAFEREVKAFLQREWSPEQRSAGLEGDNYDAERVFRKKLAANGWLTMAWPKEYGGQAASFMEQMIFAEESALVGAPGGAGLVGPTLMIHGTEEQK